MQLLEFALSSVQAFLRGDVWFWLTVRCSLGCWLLGCGVLGIIVFRNMSLGWRRFGGRMLHRNIEQEDVHSCAVCTLLFVFFGVHEFRDTAYFVTSFEFLSELCLNSKEIT